MGELSKILRVCLFLGCVGLVLLVMAKGLHSANLAATVGSTGEVLFFAGLMAFLLSRRG